MNPSVVGGDTVDVGAVIMLERLSKRKEHVQYTGRSGMTMNVVSTADSSSEGVAEHKVHDGRRATLDFKLTRQIFNTSYDRMEWSGV